VKTGLLPLLHFYSTALPVPGKCTSVEKCTEAAWRGGAFSRAGQNLTKKGNKSRTEVTDEKFQKAKKIRREESFGLDAALIHF
jgi:hypothetical protein